MSKQLFVDPREMRAPGKIEFTDILENQYQKTVKDEVGNFPREDLIRIYRDMCYIREFETMIQLIKPLVSIRAFPTITPARLIWVSDKRPLM